MRRYAYKIDTVRRFLEKTSFVKHVFAVIDRKEDEEWFLHQKFKISDSPLDFIEELVDRPLVVGEFVKIDDEELDFLVNYVKDTAEELDILAPVSDFSPISFCRRLRRLSIFSCEESGVMLPSLDGLDSITELSMSLAATKLYGISALKSQSLKTFKLGGAESFFLSQLPCAFEDFSLFSDMPQLEELELLSRSNNKSTEELLILSKLKGLKKLRLASDYFTREQYAWLAGRLPDTEGLGAVYHSKWDRQADIMRFVFLGENFDCFYDKDSGREPQMTAEYQALKERYKNDEFPPV